MKVTAIYVDNKEVPGRAVRLWCILRYLVNQEPKPVSEIITTLAIRYEIVMEEAGDVPHDILLLLETGLVVVCERAHDSFVNVDEDDLDSENVFPLHAAITAQGITLLDLDPDIETCGGGYSSSHTENILRQIMMILEAAGR